MIMKHITKRIVIWKDTSSWIFPLAFDLVLVGNNKRPYVFKICFLCFGLSFCIDEDSYDL